MTATLDNLQPCENGVGCLLAQVRDGNRRLTVRYRYKADLRYADARV